MIVSPKERNKLIKVAFDDLDQHDQEVITRQSQALMSKLKRVGYVGLGEKGALELLYVLGRWMRAPEDRKTR